MGNEPLKTLADAAVSNYNATAFWVSPRIAELTKEQLLQRPGEGRANTWWNLGHIVQSVDIAPYMNGSETIVPELYKKLFGEGSSATDDGEGYPPIAEMMELFGKAIANSTAALAILTDEQLNTPSEAELPEFLAKMSRFELASGFATHIGYHMGQISTMMCTFGKNPFEGM